MISRFVFSLIITTFIVTATSVDLFNETTSHPLISKLYLNFDFNQKNISKSETKFSELVFVKSEFTFADIMNNFNTNGLYFLDELTEKYSSLVNNNKLHVWLLSVLSSCAIGVSSMFPLLLISFSNKNCLINSDSSSKTLLKYVLSFAVGSLLGDVFLHLLPEASDLLFKAGLSARNVQLYLGFWTLAGVLCFAFAQTFFSHISCDNNEDVVQTNNQLVNGCSTNGNVCNANHSKSRSTNANISNGLPSNGYVKKSASNDVPKSGLSTAPKFNITGYLNLLANCLDNLTHGLAVGASFLVSIKIGLLTSFAIVIHEIPHEIADFAILIKSGFTKWQAVRAQASIAGVTVLGALIILFADSAEIVGVKTAWILPFTSGGFLHISLVSILPELLAEPDFGQTLKQSLLICAGVSVMAVVNLIAE